MLWQTSPGIFFLLGETVAAGLRSSGSQLCGEITCQVYEFCSSDVDHQCRRCSAICDSKSRNFDENTCDEFCQDYVHDYIRHYIKKGELYELESRLDRLNSLVGVSLLIGIILAIVALLTVMFVWIRYRKYILQNKVGDDFYKKKMNLVKYISRHSNANNNINNNSVSVATTTTSSLPHIITVNSSTLTDPPEQLNVKIPSSESGGRSSVSPPSTSSTQLCGQLPRYPSEDATLEFAAYDNLAMTPTPPRTAAVVNERY